MIIKSIFLLLTIGSLESVSAHPPHCHFRPPPRTAGGGDPHFVTWDGVGFDFHGVCDVVLMRRPGVEIHARLADSALGFSYIEQLKIQCGTTDVADFPALSYPATAGDCEIVEEDDFYVIRHNTNIVATLDDFTAQGFGINIANRCTVNDQCTGILGTTSSPLTGLVKRDGNLAIDGNDMGNDWQVGSDPLNPDPLLFTSGAAPVCGRATGDIEQCLCGGVNFNANSCPSACVTQVQADNACAGLDVPSGTFNFCVFDILSTGNIIFFQNFFNRRFGVDADCRGDPHFTTWSGEKYDFHGVCDLVLLQNPSFRNDLGMNIHIRTKRMRQWSYIHAVAISIEDETMEVMGGVEKSDEHFLLNNVSPKESKNMSIAGFPIIFNEINEKSRQYFIDLGLGERIEIKTWNAFVSVKIQNALQDDFGSSLGLMGSYKDGLKFARDNITLMDDVNDFGREWQVLDRDIKIFHNVDGPQYPQQCEIPSTSELRRRLGEKTISREDAELACSRVSEEDTDLCIFDVLATNDMESAGAY